MSRISLDKMDTRAPDSFDKGETKKATDAMLKELDDLQNLLYAERKHSLLVILQGMDASGKDGVIRDVLGNMNPQGVKVQSFKAPTEEDLSHDFLWRIHKHAPAKGMIQVFNRSHYEDILVTRVHKWCSDEQAVQRMKAINDFERLLEEHNDTHILKFYLHVSKKEQQARLEERLQNPAKMWKYNKKDFQEAERWDEYRRMYEECFEHCNNPAWIIVPADQNWYKEYIVTKNIYDLLKSLDMQFPGLSSD